MMPKPLALLLAYPALLAPAFLLAFAAWLAPAGAAERVEPIRFASGTFGTELRGSLVRGEQALYSLSARADQTLTLRIAAEENNAVFQLYAPGARPVREDGVLEVKGTALPGAGEGEDARRWSGRLPETGTYLIVVGGTRGNTTYRLDVTVR